MVEKILNNTTPYGKIWASHEGSLHSSTLIVLARFMLNKLFNDRVVHYGDGNYNESKSLFSCGSLWLGHCE